MVLQPPSSLHTNEIARIFVAPAEPGTAAKAAEKATSGLRSSIRRQRTVRGPQARLSAETRRRRMLGIVSGDPTPGDYEVWERQTSQSPPEDTDLTSATSLTGRARARAYRMFEDERMRLRDTLSFERQPPPARDPDGPLMPPVPESRDYTSFEERRREIQRLHDVRRDLRRIARRRPAPTPPYTETDLAFMARTASDSPQPSSQTPTLSPTRTSDGVEETLRAFTRSSRLLDSSNTQHGSGGLDSVSVYHLYICYYLPGSRILRYIKYSLIISIGKNS